MLVCKVHWVLHTKITLPPLKTKNFYLAPPSPPSELGAHAKQPVQPVPMRANVIHMPLQVGGLYDSVVMVAMPGFF